MGRSMCKYGALVMTFITVMFGQSDSEKCGTFVVVSRLNDAVKVNAELPSASRPAMQKSILTANGKMRIHFDTSGINEPALVSVTFPNGIKTVTRIPNTARQYIDTLAVLFDSVWRAEIDHFGFTAPPPDAGRGGGDEFDVYVLELGGGLFGETMIESDLPVGVAKPNRQYATYIHFENDFGSGYRTNGIEAIMATAAHEFHHAIQVGGSGLWETGYFYFYELCAESMEHIVFRDAKDYVFDVKTYFKYISITPLFQQRKSFETAGYERAIFAIYLMKNFGTGIMKDLWNEVRVQRPVTALQSVLNSYATSIEREFANFTFWNFYTGYRADSVKYYTDAKLYPAVPYFNTVHATPAVQHIQVNTNSFTPHYIKAVTNTDSIFFVISNTDYNDASVYAQQLFPSDLYITTTAQTGFNAVGSGVFAKFFSTDLENWSYIPIGINSPSFCFPNPFRPSASSLLISAKGVGVADDVQLTIVSATTLDLVYSKSAEYTAFSGTQYVEWKGRDHRGNIVPSGVYVYILSRGSNIVKGKFAVIR